MQPFRLICLVGAAFGLAVCESAADQSAEEQTGLKVGTKAPAFSLKDQNGKERSLGDFLAKGKVALVFYRSASW